MAAARAYVGNFGYDMYGGAERTTAAIVHVRPDGNVGVVADGLDFPNGMVITPDGCTLIVGESWGARLTAFTVGTDGTLTDRRVAGGIDRLYTRRHLSRRRRRGVAGVSAVQRSRAGPTRRRNRDPDFDRRAECLCLHAGRRCAADPVCLYRGDK
jgi:hypothetical protein